jgi:hypothetical protein
MQLAALILAILALIFGAFALAGKINNAIPVILLSVATILLAWGGAGAIR